MLEAATELEALGLVIVRQTRAVLCANADDRDFPPRDPDCPGVIELRGTADEGGGDYACPVCGRTVYPTLKAKEQINLLGVNLNRLGIEQFVAKLCGGGAAGQDFDGGVLIIPDQPQNRFVCIVDFCTDRRFLTAEWVGSQPCIYVVVDRRASARAASSQHTKRIELADLACSATLGDRAERRPRPSTQAGLATSGPRSVRPAALLPRSDEALGHSSSRKFSVGVIEEGVVIDGILVECNTFSVPYMGLTELMQQAITDVAARHEISPLTANEIAQRIKAKLPAGIVQPETVQKGLKRLDGRIVQRLRQEGRFINEGDIIENVARARKYRGRLGFRLNSDRVAIDARTRGRS